MIKKRIKCAILALIVFGAVLFFLQILLVPKYMSRSREGNLIAEYYSEADAGNTHQVILVGDCEVYEAFIPAVLWKEYGITSYVRGSPQQLIWQSYYLLEETFRYERPEAVVFNVLSMKYGEPQNEAYNRLTLDGMRWSGSKINAIKASMTEQESFLSYIFPILRFHTRWKELTADDLRYIFSRGKVSHNGYMLQTAIKPMTSNSKGGELIDYTLPDISFEYLDKMRVLCKKNGAELILVKSPANTWKYWWYDEWDQQIRDYADKYGIAYYNYINNEEIGIDWSYDTYDGGVHLNVFGAEKVTSHLGEALSKKHGIKNMKNDIRIATVWEKKLREYEKTKKEMIEEK